MDLARALVQIAQQIGVQSFKPKQLKVSCQEKIHSFLYIQDTKSVGRFKAKPTRTVRCHLRTPGVCSSLSNYTSSALKLAKESRELINTHQTGENRIFIRELFQTLVALGGPRGKGMATRD